MQQQITHQLQVADTSVSGNAMVPSWASRTALTLAICAVISACGGGGSSPDDKDPVVKDPGVEIKDPGVGGTLDPIKLEGIVAVDKTISKATVCIDLNQNKLCDTGEPKSAATGVDGKYTIEYQPADTAAATLAKASPLLAILTDASTDAADPDHTVTDKTIVLTTPAGKTQLNPLTTLVQAAVKSGMSLADAQTAVAAQLQTDALSLYDYQAEADTTTGMPGDARLKAKVTAFALEVGTAPVTLAANANAEALTQLANLVYTDANNYSYRVRVNDGVVQPDGFTHQIESRAAKAGGVATTNNELLFPSVLLTSKGWTRCDSSVPRLATRGTPWITQSCEKSTTTISFIKSVEDISGKKMSDVVVRMQQGDAELNADGDMKLDFSMTVSPNAFGDAVFPAGSQLRTLVSPQITSSPLYINSTIGDRFPATSIAQLVAGRPASAVDLADGAKTAVGGLGILDAQHLLRVAFIDDKTAQFFSCLSTAPAYTDVGMCTAHSKSGYVIEERNGVKLLSFSSFPNAGVKESRGYTEYDGNVYPYRQPLPTTLNTAVDYSMRINGVAWAAMKTVLKID